MKHLNHIPDIKKRVELFDKRIDEKIPDYVITGEELLEMENNTFHDPSDENHE